MIKLESIHRLKGHRTRVNCVSFGLVSNVAISGSSDRKAIVWCLEKGSEICTYMHGKGESVTSCSLLNGDKTAITASRFSNALHFWSSRTGEPLRVFCIQIMNGISYFYRISTTELEIVDFSKSVIFLTIHLDESDESIHIEQSEIGPTKELIIDIEEGTDQIVLNFPQRNKTMIVLSSQNRVTDAVYNCRQKKLITSAVDGTIKLFSINPDNMKDGDYVSACEMCFDSHSEGINQVCFNVAGTFALTASDDNTCFFIDLYPDSRCALLTLCLSLLPHLAAPSYLLAELVQNRRIMERIKNMLL